jgi:hypothetical protein
VRKSLRDGSAGKVFARRSALTVDWFTPDSIVEVKQKNILRPPVRDYQPAQLI